MISRSLAETNGHTSLIPPESDSAIPTYSTTSTSCFSYSASGSYPSKTDLDSYYSYQDGAYNEGVLHGNSSQDGFAPTGGGLQVGADSKTQGKDYYNISPEIKKNFFKRGKVRNI